MVEQSFGEWLKLRRHALGLSKAMLAARIGYSVASIAKIEAAIRRPSQQISERLADALEIPVAERDAFMQRARLLPAALPAVPISPARSLPNPLSALIGRETQIAEAIHLLDTKVRLLTLVGPPGVGKTRLGLEIAQRLQSAFPHGAHFVALAPVRDPTFVLDIIAQTLGLQPSGSTIDEYLAVALYGQRMLLVLDNFEHLVAAAAPVAELLVACPLLCVVATSRERLHVRGERVLQVPPLALPTSQHLHEIVSAPAVALFTEVARAAHPGIDWSDDDLHALARICARLDGLPLAIELVAANLHIRPLPILLDQLDRRFTLASTGPRDLPERHRTLRTAFDWSFALLTPVEQHLFCSLGVFVGRWTEEAAAAIVGQENVIEQLATLVEGSLVQQAHHGGLPIFELLETTRAYTNEQLEACGELEATQARHAAYYSALADYAEPHLKGEAQREWLARLHMAHPNLLAALAWLVGSHNYEQAGRMCISLRRFWWMTGGWREGRAWVGRILGSCKLSPLMYAWVQITDGMLASAQGDQYAAAAAFEQSLAVGRAEEDEAVIGVAAHNLGSTLLALGNYPHARKALEQGLDLDRNSADTWGLAVSLGTFAELLHGISDYSGAHTHFSESLSLYRQHDDYNSVVLTLNNLAEVSRCQGDFASAHTMLTEAIALARTQNLRRMLPFLHNTLGRVALHQSCIADARQHLHEALKIIGETGTTQPLDISLTLAALLAIDGNRAEHAALLLSARQSLSALNGDVLSPNEQTEFMAQVRGAQAVLTNEIFDAAWAAGQQLSISAMIASAREV